MRSLALCCVVLLAACGAEGPPIAHERTPDGLRISGTAQIGFAVNE
ncbi:MAG: argininosuccinate lyase [Alphaproteobacteria bacterium]|nr:argininosuccinate lyase [Alphaproteobacteria bacterium]